MQKFRDMTLTIYASFSLELIWRKKFREINVCKSTNKQFFYLISRNFLQITVKLISHSVNYSSLEKYFVKCIRVLISRKFCEKMKLNSHNFYTTACKLRNFTHHIRKQFEISLNVLCNLALNALITRIFFVKKVNTKNSTISSVSRAQCGKIKNLVPPKKYFVKLTL